MDINTLLEKLTIEEKIGQLLQLSPFNFIRDIEVEVFGHLKELGLTEKKIFSAGSVLGIHNAAEMIAVQEKYLRKSTHQIPLVFMADIIHGYETIFPVPLAVSTSWNPSLAFDVARVSAVEASTAGIHVTFSPMADLSRDPRWGRVVEGFGED
ncbi:MAG: beta-glucosidase, partial [Firmicutes bacterium]|nr:beta-glucosidase [Bacillota bacterium]